jgi:polyhydroxyalkanoate synthesis regulator phasin
VTDDEAKRQRETWDRIRAQRIKLMYLDSRIRKLELADLERRITALENHLDAAKAGSR